ncbi:hypothetical protein EG328_007655 [Venturia inaequalis]|uniref:Uncharacterized protein n=1 Tax=Venturia inaequalis TaxID=5025 RepID=A0A8H3UFG4_VENIN|nr:hypothetical protein EG328_007655 [Venturia inaequalis]
MAEAYKNFCDENEMFNPNLRHISPTDKEKEDLELQKTVKSFFIDNEDDIFLPLFRDVSPFNQPSDQPLGRTTEKLWMALLKRGFPEEEWSIHRLVVMGLGRMLELRHDGLLVLTVHLLPLTMPDGTIINYCQRARYKDGRLGSCGWVTCIKACGLIYEHFRCVKSGAAGQGGVRPFVRRENKIERGGLDGFIDEGEGDLVQDMGEGVTPMDSATFDLVKFDGLSVLEKLLLSVREHIGEEEEEEVVVVE